MAFGVQEAPGLHKKKLTHNQTKSMSRWSVIILARDLVAPGENGRRNRPAWRAESISSLPPIPKCPKCPPTSATTWVPYRSV